jgi:hypothetical protein
MINNNKNSRYLGKIIGLFSLLNKTKITIPSNENVIVNVKKSTSNIPRVIYDKTGANRIRVTIKRMYLFGMEL